jgi:hypothetical protein
MLELCTTVISPMTGMLQLQAPALGMPFVKQYCEENQPHIYMICVRPRISIHPEITQDGADWKLTFMINKSGQYESQTHVINLPEGVRFGEPVYPYYEIPLIDHSGQKTLSASILLQRLCEQVIPCEHIPESMYSHENIQFDPNRFNFIRSTDLEVVYVGQAFGSEGNRTAYDRLKNHETLFEVYADIVHKNPSLEPWIIIIPFDKQQIVSELSPNKSIFEFGPDEMLRRHRQGQSMDLRTRVSYTEAALIHYFQPDYNEKFKDKFPRQSHQYYHHLYSMPIEQAAVAILTNASLKCRFFSKAVKPKYQHFYSQMFNQYIDRKNFFFSLFDDQ